MKPMPLHKLAAPSPSVLSFLRAQVRHAFEPTSAPHAALKGQRCGFSTSRIKRSDNSGAKKGEFGTHVIAPSRSFAPLQSNSQHVRVAKSDAALVASQALSRNLPTSLESCAPYRRTFSTTSFSKAWQLFGGRKPNPARSLSPPPLSDVMGDAPIPIGFESLGRMTRAANELKMRCTELDDQGNVTMVSGEFKKSELIAKV
jgi:magnesium transporter